MKKPTTRDRGEYRPWFVSTIDDPAFAELDPFAFKLLFALRMTISAIGIGILRPANVMDAMACTAAELERGLQLLEAPKSGSQFGWIMREGRIVWIINALHFHKGLYPNDPKHRAFVKRELASLGDCAIVDKFRHYYKEWLGDSDTAPKAQERGLEGASEHKTTPDNTKTIPDHQHPPAREEAGADQVTAFAREIVKAANAGMQKNPAIGESLNPIPFGHGSSVAAAQSLLAAGVPTEFARSVVFEMGETFTPAERNRQIKSLGYCTDRVIDRWKSQEADSASRSAPRPAALPARGGKRNRHENDYSNPTKDVKELKWQTTAKRKAAT